MCFRSVWRSKDNSRFEPYLFILLVTGSFHCSISQASWLTSFWGFICLSFLFPLGTLGLQHCSIWVSSRFWGSKLGLSDLCSKWFYPLRLSPFLEICGDAIMKMI